MGDTLATARMKWFYDTFLRTEPTKRALTQQVKELLQTDLGIDKKSDQARDFYKVVAEAADLSLRGELKAAQRLVGCAQSQVDWFKRLSTQIRDGAKTAEENHKFLSGLVSELPQVPHPIEVLLAKTVLNELYRNRDQRLLIRYL